MKELLILLGSESDAGITKKGAALLQEFGVGFSLRVASAHRSPALVEELVTQFEKAGGKVIICVAGKSAHLAGVVAALTTLPVLAVPVYSEATAGFDALLSMSQMPAGIPVATMGFGNSGFTNAALLTVSILSHTDKTYAERLETYRRELLNDVKAQDERTRVDFEGTRGR